MLRHSQEEGSAAPLVEGLLQTVWGHLDQAGIGGVVKRDERGQAWEKTPGTFSVCWVVDDSTPRINGSDTVCFPAA